MLSAASERINPRPILTTTAAEWEAFDVRLWSAIDGCLAGALTDEELRKFKSLGMAGA